MAQEINRETAELAARWWARYLDGAEKFSTDGYRFDSEELLRNYGIVDGTSGHSQEMARRGLQLHSEMLNARNPVTREQYEHFVTALTDSIQSAPTDWAELAGGDIRVTGVSTDYWPPDIILNALESAAINGNRGVFPFKTSMLISSTGHITVDNEILGTPEAAKVLNPAIFDFSSSVAFVAEFDPFIYQALPKGSQYRRKVAGLRPEWEAVETTVCSTTEDQYLFAHSSDFKGTFEDYLLYASDENADPANTSVLKFRRHSIISMPISDKPYQLKSFPGLIKNKKISTHGYVGETSTLQAIVVDAEYAYLGQNGSLRIKKPGDILIRDLAESEFKVIALPPNMPGDLFHYDRSRFVPINNDHGCAQKALTNLQCVDWVKSASATRRRFNPDQGNNKARPNPQ